ncbi:uncharacterized protein LOC108832392 [Raphanus sativus]|uniref:Uncharacterized protein LOC108832392 n=1 Tax=Raphanus sativus TaxID=3726 RepID=A0A6J0LPU2_RAPSA|nr:uncharacterized protein LOC108832392 [Raphanus sativus]
MFERSRLSGSSIVSKALEEAEIWYKFNLNFSPPVEAQNSSINHQSGWEKPPPGFVKGNIGMAWVGSGPFTGASWVTRDRHGLPIHHSRRAFCSSPYKRESDLNSLLWAIEAMGSLRQK